MAKVLIVDDSLVARRNLCGMMLALGHDVIGEATNGTEALAEYIRLQPDLVTMDLTMADSDGAEVTSRIIAEDPQARIVVISAHQERQVILDVLERGARHFITKPVTIEQVAAVLKNVLRQSYDREKHAELIKRLKCAWGLAAGAVRRQPARVLIADDSGVARQSLREIVTSLGHVVVGEVASGAQAFVEYAKLKPDLVTMDLTMQGLGGAEATSKIVSAYPEARIVVISAMESRTGIIDALERGARHFIVKPIRKEKVAVVVNNVLNQPFDRQKHLECVRRLKAKQDPPSTLEADARCAPPYAISAQAGNFVHVFINQSITLTSCQTLLEELEEHLAGKPRLLLDFGSMSRMDVPLFAKFNDLIQTVESNLGSVRAISNNQRFIEAISQIHIENTANVLTEILKFMEH